MKHTPFFFTFFFIFP
ncbi:pheA operon leader peptide PheL [Escherichia coli]|nr:pheA operon leader peptide PheL [Escherichia coli]